MAWDHQSISVGFRGVSQRASDNLWTAYANLKRRRPNRSDGSETPPLRLAPRAMFTLDLLPALGARGKLADMFARRLSEQFGPIQVIRRVIHPVAFLAFKVGGVDYGVGITRRRHREPRKGEWYVLVDPLDAASGVTDPTIDERRTYARDLRLISVEIHAVLSTAPGVTRLRWFFEGWDVKKPGVQTPPELPWQAGFPESRPAGDASEYRSMSLTRGGSPTRGRVLALMQRHPFLQPLLGHVIVFGRLLGIMMALVGIYLSMRLLVGLTYGVGLAHLWLGGLIGVVCIVGGVCAFNMLMPVYTVQRTTNRTSHDQRT
jgi:hypothetical protein